VVLKRGNAPGDELHSNHGPCDAGLLKVADPWAECLQGLFGEGLAGPGGELGGRNSGDEEELRFLEDVNEEPETPKVFNSFIHFESMKSPSVPAVVMKEMQPELWFSPEGRREKRWRKYTTDGLMPIHASQV
jgi:hypothetical protein